MASHTHHGHSFLLAIDGLAEAIKQHAASLEPLDDLVRPRRVKPVALDHTIEPAPNLFEILLDLLQLLKSVILAKVLELDLFDELGLALFR